jgi:hypothetical protein
VAALLAELFQLSYNPGEIANNWKAGQLCLTNFLKALEAWIRLLDEGCGVDIIFVHFVKAFGTVQIRILWKKLRATAFLGKLCIKCVVFHEKMV